MAEERADQVVPVRLLPTELRRLDEYRGAVVEGAQRELSRSAAAARLITFALVTLDRTAVRAEEDRARAEDRARQDREDRAAVDGLRHP